MTTTQTDTGRLHHEWCGQCATYVITPHACPTTATTVHVHDDTPCDRPAQYAGDPFCGHGATVAEVWAD